jgi:hypothetical protein
MLVYKGRALDQAVSHRRLTAKAPVRFRVCVSSVVNKVAVGQVFQRLLSFSRVVITPLPHTHPHLHVVTRTTNGRSLGTFRKEMFFGSLQAAAYLHRLTAQMSEIHTDILHSYVFLARRTLTAHVM